MIQIINPHAGDILKYEFLEELNIPDKDLALAIGAPQIVIENIIQGKSRITADLDLRLSRYFGLSEGYFLRLQNAYELMEAKRICRGNVKPDYSFRNKDLTSCPFKIPINLDLKLPSKKAQVIYFLYLTFWIDFGLS